jgi:NAD(P)-dependent dehydrogenase (short-subunit alcohol dehydrogenase family)
VADVNEAGGAETVQLITDAGCEAAFVVTDVSDGTAVEALVTHTLTPYDSLDCAHNNAAIERAFAPLDQYPEETFDRIMKVNVKGV